MKRKSDKIHGNSTVWRYIPLDKFLHLLNYSELYFSNANALTDKYEGTLSPLDKKKYVSKLIRQGHTTDEANRRLIHKEKELEDLKRSTYVNCWTVDTYENYALWKIYLEGSKSGVAIKSTLSRLSKSIQEYDKEIIIDDVKYSDYIDIENLDKIENLNRLPLITTKRRYYEYEKEIRIIWYYDNSGLNSDNNNQKPKVLDGINMKVDLNMLIKNI